MSNDIRDRPEKVVKIARIKIVSIILALLFVPLSLLWCLFDFDWPREIYVCVTDRTSSESSDSIGRSVRDTTNLTNQIKRILRPLSPPPAGNYSFVQEPALYHDGAARCHWSEMADRKIAGIDEDKFTYDFQFLDLANCSTVDECRLICLKTHKLNDPNVCDYLTFSETDKVASLYSIDPTMHWNMTEEKGVVSALWECEELPLCDWNWRRHQILKAFKPGQKTDHFIGEFRCKDFGACQRLCETHPKCNYIISPTNNTRLGASYLYSLPITRFNADDYQIDDKLDSFEISCHQKQSLTTKATLKDTTFMRTTLSSESRAAITSTAKPITGSKRNNRSRSKRSLDDQQLSLQPSLCILFKWSIDCSKIVQSYDGHGNGQCLLLNLDRFETRFLSRLNFVLTFDKASVKNGNDYRFSFHDKNGKIFHTDNVNEKSSCERRCFNKIADRRCFCEKKHSNCHPFKFHIQCLNTLKFDYSMNECVEECKQKEISFFGVDIGRQDSSVLHVTLSKGKKVRSNIWIFFLISLSSCWFLFFISALFYLAYGKPQ